MNVLNKTKNYVSIVDSTQSNTKQVMDDENDNIYIPLKFSFWSTTVDLLFLSFIVLLIWSTLKPVFS